MSSRTSSIASISSGTSSAMGTSLTSDISRSPSSQFPHSPVDIPPIDPMAVEELEMAAKRVADNVDLLMGNLKSNLHKVRKTIHSYFAIAFIHHIHVYQSIGRYVIMIYNLSSKNTV